MDQEKLEKFYSEKQNVLETANKMFKDDLKNRSSQIHVFLAKLESRTNDRIVEFQNWADERQTLHENFNGFEQVGKSENLSRRRKMLEEQIRRRRQQEESRIKRKKDFLISRSKFFKDNRDFLAEQINRFDDILGKLG